MVLVTRIPDPELPPCAAALLCEVNFTVTRSGLEGQLLGVTIQHEQPELERAKSEMLAKEEAFKVQRLHNVFCNAFCNASISCKALVAAVKAVSSCAV
jgi:ATP-binding dynein motor region